MASSEAVTSKLIQIIAYFQFSKTKVKNIYCPYQSLYIRSYILVWQSFCGFESRTFVSDIYRVRTK